MGTSDAGDPQKSHRKRKVSFTMQLCPHNCPSGGQRTWQWADNSDRCSEMGKMGGHLVQTPVDVLKQCCSSLLSRSEVPEATLGEGSWQQSLLTVALDGDYALGPSSALWSSHGSACPTLAPAQSSDRALWSKAPGNRRTPATKPPEKPRRHSGAWACRAGDSALVVLLPLCSLHRSRTSPPPIPQAPF
jgi:hypothetical protein